MPGYATPGGVGSGLGTLDPFGRTFYEENPEAGWYDYLAELGVDDYSGLGRFSRGIYGDTYGRYQANLARDTLNRTEDPNLNWVDYMRTQSPKDQFSQLGPQERGERDTPRLRWLMNVI